MVQPPTSSITILHLYVEVWWQLRLVWAGQVVGCWLVGCLAVWLLVVGCWLLVVGGWWLVGGWLLVVGCWLLVVGCWLVVGFWLLVVGCCCCCWFVGLLVGWLVGR